MQQTSEPQAARHDRPMRPWLWGLVSLAAVLTAALVLMGLVGGVALVPAAGLVLSVVVALAGAAGLIWLYAAVLERRVGRIAPTNVCRPHAARELAAGLAGGIAFMGASVLVLAAVGALSIVAQPTADFTVDRFLDGLSVLILVPVAEELLARGVLLEALRRWIGPWTALVVSALVFGVGHLGNEGATLWSAVAIALEAGLLLGAWYLLTDSLWVVIGIHIGWNFTLNVLGLPSGPGSGTGLLTITQTGPDWLTGGAFGVEGSVVPVVLGLAASVLALVLWRRRLAVAPADVPTGRVARRR